jgi:hypothetical protein
MPRRALRGVAVLLATVSMTSPCASQAAGVSVWDTSGARPVECRAIDSANPSKASGGCMVEAKTGRPIRVRVRSMVGDLTFGNCVYPHTLRIDGSGRTANDIRKVDGPRPCNDIRPCWSKRSEPFANQPFLTWSGQIRLDARGQIHNHVDACFETCMGRFEGDVDIALEPARAIRRAVVSRDLLGGTGFELDGYWNADLGEIDVRPSAGPSAAVAPSVLLGSLGASLGLSLGGARDR